MPRQTRKTPQERQEAVKAVALKLFQERGFHNVTTKDIAEASGLSRALIYRYKISKHELLSEILRDMIAAQAQQLSTVELNRSSPQAMIFDYFERLFLLDMTNITLRRLAVQHSWTWDQKTETAFYVQMGAIFEPIDGPLRTKWGIDLHEPARHALWAIYTESLRTYLGWRGEQTPPAVAYWRLMFQPQAGLVIAGLASGDQYR
ncbi:MAG: TetR/AcrR family transcriptional regulator [Hyphomicrobiaceae bacterium]